MIWSSDLLSSRLWWWSLGRALRNILSGAPCFLDEAPGSPGRTRAHPWLISALKGIGLISQQPVRPGQVTTRTEQWEENAKTKRLSFHCANGIGDFSGDCKERMLYSTENWILNISLPVFVQRGSLTLTIFLLSMIFSKKPRIMVVKIGTAKARGKCLISSFQIVSEF